MNYSKQVRGAWLDLGVAGWGTVFAVYVLYVFHLYLSR